MKKCLKIVPMFSYEFHDLKTYKTIAGKEILTHLCFSTGVCLPKRAPQAGLL